MSNRSGHFEVGLFFRSEDGPTELIARTADRRVIESVRRRLIQVHERKMAALKPELKAVPPVDGDSVEERDE